MKNKEKKKGLFIVLDGIDGCGKTTQAKLLSEFFIEKGYSVFLTSEPSKSKFGVLFRENLKSKEFNNIIDAYLISMDRIIHCQEIESALNEGKIVICDRYVDSTIAYQLLSYGKFSKELDYKFLKTLNKFAIAPDIIFILNISPELALERMIKSKKDLEKFEQLDILQRLSENFSKFNVFDKEAIYSYVQISKEIDPLSIQNSILSTLLWFKLVKET